MKYFNWVKDHKYQVAVFGLFVLCGIVIYLFIQGIKKDHTLELSNIKLELKEEARVQIEKERSIYQEREKQLTHKIFLLKLRDSLLANNNLIIDNKLRQLPFKLNDQINKITNYGSADLYEYYIGLPSQPLNDY